MSIRAARVLILVAAGLMCLGAGLGGCSTSPKFGDSAAVGQSAAADSASPAPRPATPPGRSSPRRPSRGRAASRSRRCRSPASSATIPTTTCSSARNISAATISRLAEQKFRSAVEKHPNDAEAWIGLAASYDRLRRFDLADRAYAQVLRLIGPTVEVLNDEGFSYMLRGDYAARPQILEQAQAKDPANPYVQANLQLLNDSLPHRKAVQ